MRLEDVAKVCRTKNAGAFLMTIDLIFEDADVFELATRRLTPAMFASLYQVPLDRVEVSSWDQLRAIKATVPRSVPAGSPGDRDVYGCQQHSPLLTLEL